MGVVFFKVARGDVCESVKLEWVDPVGKSSPLPPTAMQDLPGDADEKTARYHRALARLRSADERKGEVLRSIRASDSQRNADDGGRSRFDEFDRRQLRDSVFGIRQ